MNFAYIAAFSALIVVLPGAAFAQDPPASLTAVQAKQLVKAHSVVARFWKAARQGDVKTARSLCAAKTDINCPFPANTSDDSVLGVVSSASLKRWAVSIPAAVITGGKGRLDLSGKKTYAIFGYRKGVRKGDVVLCVNPDSGKIVGMDEDFD